MNVKLKDHAREGSPRMQWSRRGGGKGMQSVYPDRRIKGTELRVRPEDKLTVETEMPSPTSSRTATFPSRREGWEMGSTVDPSQHSKSRLGACRHLLLYYNDLCVFFRGADLTSTSYVYSSLVRDDAGRVVGGAAVHAPVADLSAGDVQVADHIPLRRDHLADAVTAALENWVVVQGPRDRGQRGPLHVAHEGNRFCWAHHFFTKGRNDFGSSICRKTNVEGSGMYE